MTFTIRPLAAIDLPGFREHFVRHCAESGRGEPHFMPYSATTISTDGPRGLRADNMQDGLDVVGWQRWFAAFNEDDGGIVGHVDLSGDELRTGLHRCELGIGIERPFRSHGLGVRLMQTAIAFAQAAGSIAWVDLKVFGHNAPERALYKRLGFVETGVQHDRFRIDGAMIDDLSMSLRLTPPHSNERQQMAQQQ